MQIDFQVDGDPKSDLSFDKKYALYRIVTEALHNCVKHAKAKTVEVTLSCRRGQVEAVVLDNGRGFEAAQAMVGHGLASMRERAEAVDGSLRIESGDQGTTVLTVIPR